MYTLAISVYELFFLQTKVIDITFDAEEGPKGLSKALDRICEEARRAAQESYQFIILSDRNAGASRYLLHFTGGRFL
jgi:Glutamate synthase central domain.